MANLFVRSSDGNDADDGSTWALAKATLGSAITAAGTYDTIYVSDNHSQTQASTLTLSNTVAFGPVICCDDAGDPSTPSASATSAVLETTGAFGININSGASYFHGLTFKCATGGTGANLGTGANSAANMWFDSCSFQLVNTGTTQISAGNTVNFGTRWTNCTVKFAAAGQGISAQALHWDGGSVLSGGTSPTNLITLGNKSVIENVDLSNCSSGVNLVALGLPRITFRNCRLPASWSGQLVSSKTQRGNWRVAMYNCDSADTNYRLWIESYPGTILSETTVVRTGGASDGTTGLSWKMVTASTANMLHSPLISDEIVQWNETTGSAITVTAEVVTDNVTLTDAEAWIEVAYLGTSGVPLATTVSDRVADVLGSAASQSSSSETWTTTGLTTPVKQKLSVTFTPAEKGFVHAVVKLAKASTTAYVCPKLTLT